MRASRGEIKIEEILKMANVEFEEEYMFSDLFTTNGTMLRFDFAVFDDDGELDFLIEYQGEQHYEPKSAYGGKKAFVRQKYNDNLKREYCKKHNIKLIEVPYWDLYKLDYDYLFSASLN